MTQIPLTCIFLRFVLLAMNTPLVAVWTESQNLMSLIISIVVIFTIAVAIKIFVSKVLMVYIRNRYEQDLIDSQTDDLDKDVIERLSTIEKYTVLRSDSSMIMLSQ